MKRTQLYYIFVFVLLSVAFGNELQASSDKKNSTSFMELSISDKMRLEAQEKHQHLQTLIALSSKPRNTRKTLDDRKCADEFQADNDTVIKLDCTTKPSPDGKMSEEEWCKVDSDQGGDPDWGFCVPNLDYDKVRVKVKDLMEEEIPEMRKIIEEEGKLIPIGVDLIQTFEKIKKKQAECVIQLEAIKKSIESMEEGYALLLKLQGQWEELQRKVVILEGEIAEIKKTYTDIRPENSEGVLGYEEEPLGDGLKGYYFDNEGFVGSSKMQIDPVIDFDWAGEPPKEGINHENFSIRWEGMLKAPCEGNYIFTTITDDGAQLYLNDQQIITHNMYRIEDQKTSWMTIMHKEEDAASQFKASESIKLAGGMKYHLKMLIYHSVHNEFNPGSASFAKLKWESDAFQIETVESIKLFSFNKPPILKVVGYYQEDLVLTILQNNADAFKDVSNYKLQDVPLHMQNMHMLKADSTYKKTQIKLATTCPVTIFVAVHMLNPNPLSGDFEDTQEVMSVLKISKATKVIEGIHKAKKSEPFKIYKKNFLRGDIDIPLTLNEKTQGTQLIAFYALDSGGSQPSSCGGAEILVSNPEREFFKECSASSSFAGGMYNCEHGFAGKMEDAPFGMWATNGEGLSAWIQIDFKSPIQVTTINYRGRAGSNERNKKITTKFSSGEEFSTILRNTDSIQPLKLQTQSTDFVKFTIDEVYSSNNNGGAFDIMGIPCFVEPGETYTDPANDIDLKCEDTYSDNDEIIKRAFKDGDIFRVHCATTCVDQKETLDIFGSMQYSSDSSLCLAAFHSGSLGKDGGAVKVVVNKGLVQYEQENRNGFSSQAKEGNVSGKSVKFIKIPDDSTAALDGVFDGMKVDLFDEANSKWVPGQVVLTKRSSKKILDVEVLKDGYPETTSYQLPWPQPRLIDYCGEKIKDRECDKKSTKPITNPPTEVKICFTPKESCPEGWKLDKGQPFSDHDGIKYGWGRDMSKNLRSRQAQPDPLLANLILFPPYKTTPWCKKANPDVVCDPVDWSIDLPVGKYDVKVSIGDAEKAAVYNMQINEQSLYTGQALNPDQFMTKTLTVANTGDGIKITAMCDPNQDKTKCDETWTRMSTVWITENQSPDVADNGQVNEVQNMGCGNSFRKGRCSDGTDPTNCVFNSIGEVGADKCTGAVHLVKIPETNLCKEQRGMFKCILNKFTSQEACGKTCPGKCLNLECKVPLVQGK